MRKGAGFKVGDGAAAPTNGVKTRIDLRRYTWDLVSQATTRSRARALTEGGRFWTWREGKHEETQPPLLWQVGTPRYHLFVIFNWQRAKEARSYINPTQYGSVLGNWSLPKPSLLFSHDAEGSAEHPQPNLQQGWVGAVFTCVLCQGTELTAHTGLHREDNFLSWCCSNFLHIITTWSALFFFFFFAFDFISVSLLCHFLHREKKILFINPSRSVILHILCDRNPLKDSARQVFFVKLNFHSAE